MFPANLGIVTRMEGKEMVEVKRSSIHTEKSNKMQQCIKILLFHIYVKLNMFRATRRPSSGT